MLQAFFLCIKKALRNPVKETAEKHILKQTEGLGRLSARESEKATAGNTPSTEPERQFQNGSFAAPRYSPAARDGKNLRLCRQKAVRKPLPQHFGTEAIKCRLLPVLPSKYETVKQKALPAMHTSRAGSGESIYPHAGYTILIGTMRIRHLSRNRPEAAVSASA